MSVLRLQSKGLRQQLALLSVVVVTVVSSLL